MEAFSMQESPAISSCDRETNHIHPKEPKAKSRPLFWFVFLFSQIVGLLAVILVFVWIQSYDDGFPNQLVFDYHPPFMVLGMIFCFGESLLVFRVFPGCAKIGLKILHAVLLVASLVIGAVGMRAAYNPGKGTPYSLHSWIGIIAFTLYGLQWLIGFIVFLLPRISAKVRTKLLPTHVAVGVIIFVFTIVAVLTGINEKNFFPGDYAALPPAARVGNAVGLLVISFGSLVIYLLYRNDYARKESPPLT
uniref:Cytochrome b561 n=1 Tax=Schistocephalus solidus TaxID=70667 RepID=A0A0V0J7P8_SCHSO